jgi:hypothetical protein
MPKERLHLHEEVLLLALRNDKGTVAGGVMYQQAAGGALLAELILENRVSLVTAGRSTYAVVQDPSPTGEPLLDECLRRMATATRRATLPAWIGRFAGLKRLRHRAASGLREKGILREEEGTVLLLFTRRLYPELDPAYEREILRRLDAAIAADSVVDARTSILLALAHHSGLLKANFDRGRLKERRARIEKVIAGEAVGKATKQAIDAVTAAILVTTMVPIIAAHH